jgi:tetratricopeptide (TPR) repeat protein
LPARTCHFVGREQYLKDIKSVFFDENKKVVIISSFPGTGKTTLANEIAYRFTDKTFNNHLAYWVKSDGKNSDFYFENFAKYELHINLDEKNDKEFIIRQIKITLTKATETLLFIFDNCDDYQNIKDYLTMILSLQKTKIMITTTRNSFPIEYLKSEETKIIIIEPFNQNESLEFIKNGFGNGITDEETNQILRLLETSSDEFKMPNDLIKLIEFVKLNQTRFQKITVNFIKKLNEKMKKSNITISDDEIFELIIKKNPESWNFLKRCSFLDPDFIPIELFSDLFGFDINDLEIRIIWLKNISIISTDTKDEEKVGLRIHRTIKKGIENYLEKKPNEKNKLENELIEKFQKLLKSIKKNETIKKKTYFLHLKTIAEKLVFNGTQNNSVKATIASEYGDYLKNTNYRIDEALKYYQKSIEIKILIEKNKKLFELNNILNKKDEVFGTKCNESIAAILDKIGEIFGMQGKYKEAIENFNKSLDITRKIYGSDEHATIATTLQNIGLVLYNQGKYKEALEHFNKSLEINRKVYGSDEHATIATTLQNIGLVLYNQGKFKEALEHFNKSLEIHRKIYGSDEHPSIATTLQNIGSVLNNQGKFKEALEHFNKSLEIEKKVYGTDEHPSIATTLQNIGSVLKMLGKYKEVMEHFEKSLEINRKVFRTDEHPSIATTLQNMGSVLNAQGKYDKALDHFYKSLEIKRKVYGTDEHATIATTLHNIGLVLYNQGKHEEALEHFNRSLEINRIMYGNDEHANIATTLQHIGSVLNEPSKNMKTLEPLKKSVQIKREKICAEGNATFATTYDEHANIATPLQHTRVRKNG